MPARRLLLLLLSFAGPVSLLACAEAEREDAALVLAMPSAEEVEEARERPLPEPGDLILGAAAEGPAISVLKPGTDEEVTSPFAVDVRFEAREGTQVDLSTLSLCAVVGWMCIYEEELTAAIRPFTTIVGISHPKVELDRKGSFRLRLTIGDTKGLRSSKSFRVTLK